ncbi:MAG: hypothetical protein PHG66_01980 [Candidatus Colwellbacteria bacterium]|nr:hypothetical protein [Candidatus Colwellbacteria bacterium]
MSLKLEEFLSELTNRVRNDNLSDEMTKSLADLFLLNELEKTGRTSKSLLEEKDMKYYITGWFVHNLLSCDESKQLLKK